VLCSQPTITVTVISIPSMAFSYITFDRFLADRTNGRAIGTVLRLSVVCRRL